MFELKILGENTCEIKKHLYFCKTDKCEWLATYLREIILADDPCQECQENVEFSIEQEAVSLHFW